MVRQGPAGRPVREKGGSGACPAMKSVVRRLPAASCGKASFRKRMRGGGGKMRQPEGAHAGEDTPAERLSAATAFGTTGGIGMKKQILTMKFIFNKEGKTYSAPSHFSSGIGRTIAL